LFSEEKPTTPMKNRSYAGGQALSRGGTEILFALTQRLFGKRKKKKKPDRQNADKSVSQNEKRQGF